MLCCIVRWMASEEVGCSAAYYSATCLSIYQPFCGIVYKRTAYLVHLPTMTIFLLCVSAAIALTNVRGMIMKHTDTRCTETPQKIVLPADKHSIRLPSAAYNASSRIQSYRNSSIPERSSTEVQRRRNRHPLCSITKQHMLNPQNRNIAAPPFSRPTS